jgi:hypothetical protein
MGFAALSIILLILSFAMDYLKTHSQAALIVIYCLGLFFFNFGANTTTFILAGEVFPTKIRSTASMICVHVTLLNLSNQGSWDICCKWQIGSNFGIINDTVHGCFYRSSMGSVHFCNIHDCWILCNFLDSRNKGQIPRRNIIFSTLTSCYDNEVRMDENNNKKGNTKLSF